MRKIKLLTSYLFLLPLCVAFLGAGCEKDDIYDSDSIIGKWKWIYTSGGVIGETFPQEEQTVILEFTEDSIPIEQENGETAFETEFNVSGDTLKYFRGTDLQYKINIEGDTLALYFIIEGFDKFYKRMNYK